MADGDQKLRNLLGDRQAGFDGVVGVVEPMPDT